LSVAFRFPVSCLLLAWCLGALVLKSFLGNLRGQGRTWVLVPIVLVEADTELTKPAASLKAQHNLPYAECFAAALAHTRKATLVTSDKDFERVAGSLKIFWI